MNEITIFFRGKNKRLVKHVDVVNYKRLVKHVDVVNYKRLVKHVDVVNLHREIENKMENMD